MQIAKTKEGLAVHVHTQAENDGPDWRDTAAFKARFQRHGYVIARNFIPEDLADAVVTAFRSEVKPYTGAILRQVSVRMEQNRFSENGFMTNTILSVQDMADPQTGKFRQASLEVLTHARIQDAMQCLIGEPAQCVESMYFESSNRGTISHADCHFMDASQPGQMVGAWFALEDIHPEAGRFYILPESHLLGTDAPRFAHLRAMYKEYEALSFKALSTFAENTPETNAAYRIQLHKMLSKGLAGLVFEAPMMKKGDVVFWGSRVMHGSLIPRQLQYSRNSLTSHYIGISQSYMQYGAPVELHARAVNGMPVHHLRPIRKDSIELQAA